MVIQVGDIIKQVEREDGKLKIVSYLEIVNLKPQNDHNDDSYYRVKLICSTTMVGFKSNIEELPGKETDWWIAGINKTSTWSNLKRSWYKVPRKELVMELL